MNQSYIECLRELFSDRASVTPEKLKAFMGGIEGYLRGLYRGMASKDPRVREEASGAIFELQLMLESQKASIARLTGLDVSKISDNDLMASLSEKDREMMMETKQQFIELESSFTPQKGRCKRRNKINFQG